MSDKAEIEGAVEAILFAAGEPVRKEELLAVFDDGDRGLVEEALEEIMSRYQPGDGRGVMGEEVGGGFRLVTRPELHGYLRKYFEASGANRLSMAALETLAIVAYRQPITSPEVQELRGVSSNSVLKTLLERRLVRIAGRKEVVGRPFLYRTTREFLMHFGLKDLNDLPPLEDIEAGFDGEVELFAAASDRAEPGLPAARDAGQTSGEQDEEPESFEAAEEAGDDG